LSTFALTLLRIRVLPWRHRARNGEDGDYPYPANYSKGLPHNDFGEVDTDADRLTVGGELDKVASNIAIGILRDVVRVGHEAAAFGLTRFDGTRMTV
jgi:hypothetical protein